MSASSSGHRIRTQKYEQDRHAPLGLIVEGHTAFGRQQLKVEVDEGKDVEDALDGGGPVEPEACKHAQHLHEVLPGREGGEGKGAVSQ